MTTYWLLGKVGFPFRIQVCIRIGRNSRRSVKKEFDEAKNADGSSYVRDIEEIEEFVIYSLL